MLEEKVCCLSCFQLLFDARCGADGKWVAGRERRERARVKERTTARDSMTLALWTRTSASTPTKLFSKSFLCIFIGCLCSLGDYRLATDPPQRSDASEIQIKPASVPLRKSSLPLLSRASSPCIHRPAWCDPQLNGDRAGRRSFFPLSQCCCFVGSWGHHVPPHTPSYFPLPSLQRTPLFLVQQASSIPGHRFSWIAPISSSQAKAVRKRFGPSQPPLQPHNAAPPRQPTRSHY
jgi:hypothetical protein